MPELPEVETVVRTLRPQVLECCIERVEVLRERSLHPLSLPVERLAGTRISAARRRGKLALLDLEPPAVAAALPVPSILAVHLRMTGRFMVHPEGAAPLKHTRIIFHLQRPDGSRAQLFFDDVRSFGLVFAATPELLERWDFWRSLGPEPLDMGARFSGAASARTPGHQGRPAGSDRTGRYRQYLCGRVPVPGRYRSPPACRGAFGGRSGTSPLRFAGGLAGIHRPVRQLHP